MKILNFSLLEIGEKVFNETEFYDAVFKKRYDVLIIDFENYNYLHQVRNEFFGKVIFVLNYCDIFTYKKVLKLGDYCFNYFEFDKIMIRLDYIKKEIYKLDIFKYKNLIFHLNTNQLYKGNLPVNVTKSEIELLKTLIKFQDRFISKMVILEECEYIESVDSIKVMISKLRKFGFNIQNKKNIGYKLIKDEI